MSENVVRLPVGEKHEPKAQYTLTYTLPNGRQITAVVIADPSDGLSADEALESVSKTLDRVRARYEIGVVYGEEDTLNGEIAAHEEAMKKAAEEAARVEKESEDRIAELHEKHDGHVDKWSALYAEAQAEAEGKGRVFDPERGGIKSKLSVEKAEADKCKAEILKIREEIAKGREIHKANMDRFAKEIADRKAKRDARLQLLGP